MTKLKDSIRRISAIILDMDGVLYLGRKPIKGAAKAVAFLRGSGKKVIFLTNNSENSRLTYLKKLSQMGITASHEEVVTSGQVAADYVKKKNSRARVFAIGGRGLMAEIRKAGLRIASPKKATHLVVGIDRAITYNKIDAGLQALLSGAKFIATNPDNIFPTSKGLTPGAGAIIGALERSSSRKPDVIIGKPYLHAIRFGLRILETRPSETAIIGDQIATDIKAGKRIGLTTILVLSGVTKKGDIARVKGTKNEPDFIVDSLEGVIT